MTSQTVATWWDRAYRVALRAFPDDFRAQWGEDMQRAFDARVRAHRSAVGRVPVRLIARELGGVVRAGIAEHLHSNARQLRMVHAQDVRYAFRLLFRSPGFTLLTVLVLAGGLGLSTFTFSFLHTAMIRALPLGDGDRIVRIDGQVNGRRQPVDVVDVAALRTSLVTLTEVGGYSDRELVVGRDGDRRVVDATGAEPVLFSVARTPALFGRTLLPSDAEPGAEPVIVLSFRTWEVVFGADRALLDTRVAINGVSTRVVGIMPEGFGFPVASEAWVPLPDSLFRSTTPGLASVRLVGRLGSEVSHAAATAEVGPRLARALVARDTSLRAGAVGATVESFPAVQFGEERALVFALLNLLAALILLLALVNVTNLLLARANERIRETAVRLALGASGGRLVMQGMWETVLLCLAGGIVGTAGAAWGLAAITQWTRANMEGNLAFWWVWQVDHVTLLGAATFATLAIAILGSVVTMRVLRTNVREVMQDGSARSGSRSEGRLSRMLVTTQVATVTVLMFFGVMAGVMARRVVTIDPGFVTARLLQGALTPPEARYPGAAQRAALFRDAHARLGTHEAIEGVLFRRTMAARYSGDGAFALRDARRSGESPDASIVATLGAMKTLGIDVVEGREFTDGDDASRASIALVSRSLAAKYWPGRSPVGDQVRLGVVGDTTQWRTIVGVVSDVPYGNPLSRDRSPDALYIPLLQSGTTSTAMLMRYRTSEVAAREAMLQTLGALDPLLMPESVQPFTEVLQKTAMLATSVSKLFGACFAFALVLALVGTYGLMSRAIGLRRREIGVRRALGASDASVTRLLLTQGGRQLGIGTLIAAPILAAVGFGFTRFFPVSAWLTAAVGLGVSLAIVAAVLAATWVPARHVLRVTPRDALWSE
ncbi:MAG: ABC transporter permease [Gemmatimonadaceae bacterium]|nr:ABC transporter permease [Gemmatimonadaceae bacterium]